MIQTIISGDVIQKAPISLPSTSSDVTSARVSSPASASKRKRQLTLYGSTKGTYISENEQNEIDRILVEMIVSDFQPLSIVENKGFLKYTEKLNRLYNPQAEEKLLVI